MIIEVMGRDVGWIALYAGLASSADVILIPEIPFDIKKILSKIAERDQEGRHFSIVVVGEGAKPRGGGKIYYRTKGKEGVRRLGGIGDYVARAIAKHTDHEVRVTTLGHVQRGGSPSNFDRVLGMRFGHAAAHLIAQGGFGKMVALKGNEIITVSLDEAIGTMKHITPDNPLLKLAKDLGTEFGR